MARKHRPHRKLPAWSSDLDDLYDYAGPRAPGCGYRPSATEGIRVTDDWPETVPVMEGEIRVLEAHLADVLDELFGPLP